MANEKLLQQQIRILAGALYNQYESNIKIVSALDGLIETLKEQGVCPEDRLSHWSDVRESALRDIQKDDALFQEVQAVAQSNPNQNE